jgi:glycyl-tRNA synthetase beta chain
MKNSFLFELGLEEIPAEMIRPAIMQLRETVAGLLEDHALTFDSLETYAAPRRLAVAIGGLPERQSDREELLLGPPIAVAFQDGAPGPAAHGFARKMGVSADRLEVVSTPKGEYVGVRHKIEGLRTPKIFSAQLPGLIASIGWPKNMYWQESRFRFIRPIRWLVALWNQEVVPFEFEGVKAGSVTRGHRFLGSQSVHLDSAGEYLNRLRENYVLADVEERRRKIVSELDEETAGLKLIPDPDLIELVTYLNEYPTVLRGSFNPDFLRIPQEVLVTVMRHHQKYFSLADSNGNLHPSFLTVLNTGGDPEGKIRKGHEKVLRARLEDAAFFWTSDRKKPLAARLASLEHVLFQERLGSYREKTERVRDLCSRLSDDESLAEAALLCKCDLTSDMVREFTELQGVMGGLYARAEGYPEPVWKAVYEHYRPMSFEDSSPTSLTGALLSIADKLDTVVGCFAVGITPSGSSDPFALRRQALGLVKVLFDHRLDRYPLPGLVETAARNLAGKIPAQEGLVQVVVEFLTRRVRFILQEQGIAYDVLNAVLGAEVAGVHDAWQRAKALTKMRGEPDFEAIAVAFKRIRNILAKQEVSTMVSERDLEEPAETELYASYLATGPEVMKAADTGNYIESLHLLAGLRKGVDRFFDDVMVLTEDARLRNNRLALLKLISGLFLKIADVSEIQEAGLMPTARRGAKDD